jgi:hypothetical protein
MEARAAPQSVRDRRKSYERAERCEKAADIVDLAMARYEVGADLPGGMLGEAGRRARETLRVEQIGTAPARIRSELPGYRLRVLEWCSPAFVPLPFPLAAGTKFKARKPIAASRTLSEAIGRYGFESAATESDLQEAERRASEALEGR